MKTSFPAIGLLALLLAGQSFAGSATWNSSPSSGDWNTAANWTPATVPNGPNNTATFDVSNTTEISLSSGITLNGILYTPTASAFSTNINTNSVTISGMGINNGSGKVQRFLVPVNSSGGSGTIQFFNNASASSGVAFTVQGSVVAALSGGLIQFWDSATAETATFTLEGGGAGARTFGGQVFFNETSNAGNATFVCKSGGDGTFGGTLANVSFHDSSSAGNATLTALGATSVNNFNGVIVFDDTSSAENATLIAMGSPGIDGGVIIFIGSPTGGNASVKLFGTGNLQIQPITGPSLTIGSLEGDGAVITGGKSLVVGTNGRDTTYSGLMSEGTLTKTGTGTLVLSGANTYAGGTTVLQGGLLTNNSSGSATGTGAVQVNRGFFGGNGIVTGAVTIGTGAAKGAALAPGLDGAGRLTLQSSLAFKANSRYTWKVDGNALKADEVLAQGVTIESGVTLQVNGRGLTLPSGTVFTIISNTSASPISGNFSNLADGSTLTIGSNTFQANYEGGDGNDLTLTVIP